MLRYTIPINPVTKKNSQRLLVNPATGKPFIAQSEAFKIYEGAAGWFLQGRPKIDYPVNVCACFYMQTQRRVDLVNLQEALLDVLVKYEILADDNSKIVYSMDGSRVYYDRENPRTEVFIEKVML